MAPATVGVVVRAKSVDVVDVRLGFAGLRLVKAASALIEGSDESNLTAAIRAALAQANIAASRVAVSVPSQDVLLRSFVMPLLPKAEWFTAIQFEARKYIPFKTQELVWTSHVEELRATKQMRVAFVGIRNETLARIRSALAAAGLKASVIEAQAVSVARVAAQIRARTKTPAATSDTQFTGIVDVDVDGNLAHLIIAKQGVPYFSRDVSLKRERDQAPSGANMDPRVEVLLSELRLSFDFFTRENPQASIQDLIVFGDQVTIGSWVPWLAEHLSCPVSIGTLPITHGNNQQANLHFACGVGVVERGFWPTKIRLEFQERPAASLGQGLSMSLKGKLDPAMLKAMGRAAVPQAVTALMLVGVLAAVGQQQIANATANFQTMKRAFSDVGWNLSREPLTSLQALKQQVDTRLGAIQKLQAQRVSVTEKLDVLAKRLPENVWLEGLNYDNRLDRSGGSQPSLSVHGACFQPDGNGELDVIREFADQLKSDRKFFRGFTISQLAEVGRGEGGRQRQLSYRTFKLNYNASSDRRM